MAETWNEMLSRLELMAENHESDWDLSVNDELALREAVKRLRAPPATEDRGGTLTASERYALRVMGACWAGTDGRTKEATEAWNAAGLHLLTWLDLKPLLPRLGCGEALVFAPPSAAKDHVRSCEKHPCHREIECACTMFTDGSSFVLGSFAGGGAREGAFSMLRGVFTRPDGTVEIIHYRREPAVQPPHGEGG